MCRDCIELAIEITYTGWYWARRSRALLLLERVKEEVQQIFQLLSWMTNLTSLALIKLGDSRTDHYTLDFDENINDCLAVHSRLLEDLLQHVFAEERRPKSLQRLWIHNFYLCTRNSCYNLLSAAKPGQPPSPLKSFYFSHREVYFVNESIDLKRNFSDEFFRCMNHITRNGFYDDVEHFAEFMPHLVIVEDSDLGSILPNLKYVRVSSRGDRQVGK